MIEYHITFQKQAIKALSKLNDPIYSRIKLAIQELASNPKPKGFKQLKGRSGFRIRIGDYRVIYEIDGIILQIDIIDLGHRKDIYE
jgi:mRNA interferase RelE/StbE